MLKYNIIYKWCLVKYNKSCLKCVKLSALYIGRGGVMEGRGGEVVVRLLKCYIHTDRPSDEPGCRGAFAPKNSRTCRVLSPNLHRGFLHNFRKPARLFVCSSTVRPRRGDKNFFKKFLK